MTEGGTVADLSKLLGARHLLQTELWGRFKSEYGWRPRAIEVDGAGAGPVVLALFRTIGPVTICYVPYPPLAGSSDGGRLHEVASQICEQAGVAPVYVRFDLLEEQTESPSGPSIRKARVDVQPPTTVILDLGADSADLLAAMHKKNRYNIGLAERKGVTVRRGTIDEIAAWYSLYRETASRDRISIHPQRYYERLFELAAPYESVDLHLYLAEFERQLLAGIIVSHFGGVATYLYGASSDRRRDLMPNYALQWHAISVAQEAGCGTYDLFGVPPADDKNHPMYGLYRFKTGFGGTLVHRLGSWDVVLKPTRYRAYRLLESAREYYHHRWRKRSVR